MDETFTVTLAPEDSGSQAGPRVVDLPEPLGCTAERAECTCPEFCERDHANE